MKAPLIECLDFHYARICERNRPLLAGHFEWYAKEHGAQIEDMIRHITYPLQQQSGTEALRGVMYQSEVQLLNGRLRNPLEVEVSLIAMGRVSPLSDPII